jgi:hypothetical protein
MQQHPAAPFVPQQHAAGSGNLYNHQSPIRLVNQSLNNTSYMNGSGGGGYQQTVNRSSNPYQTTIGLNHSP